MTLLLLCLMMTAQPRAAAQPTDVTALADSAFALKDRGEYQSSIDLFLEVLPQLPADSTELRLNILSDLTDSYFRIADLDKALYYGRLCLEEDEKSGVAEDISTSLSNLAALCLSADQFDQAEEYLLRSVAIERELGRDTKLSIRLGMLSELYTKTGRLDEALSAAEEALALERSAGREEKVAIRLSQLGNTLLSLKCYDEAIAALQEAEQLHRAHQNTRSLSLTFISLAQASRALHRTSEAEAYLRECITLSEQAGTRRVTMSAYLELAHLYNDLRDARAYDYLNQYMQLHDTVVNEQVLQQIADLEVGYETHLKEQRIALQEVTIQRQRLGYVAMGLLVVILLVSLYFIRRSLKLKEQSLRLKDDLMRLISHDLKNPAIAQQQSLHALSQYHTRLGAGDVQQQLNLLAEQSDAHVGLLCDLLDWAGMQTGRLRYTPIDFCLASLTSEVVAQHQMQARVKGITVELQTVGEATHIVHADRQMVAAIVRNLLSNAIKFSPAQGTIEVCVEASSLCITDHGTGFDWEQQRRRKTTQKGTRGETGTALGLDLALKMADINHAQLSISTPKGAGTTAKLSF